MAATHTTITSKGQITLPAEIRHALGLEAGQKVDVRIENGNVVITPPESITALRVRLRQEAERKGTWGGHPVAGDGWTAAAEERHAQR